jgi:yersiniabactin nonribosomal peptide/polyketide synthase
LNLLNPCQLPGNPALEKQVAELWQSLLSRPVARHHDFFESGGDSLMATRMVAQLNQRGIASANLQDLFTHSTLSDFCAHLQACSAGEDNPIPICQGDGDETLFVFHASDGDVSAWLPLASALNMPVFGLQAKSPQRFATLDQMIDEYVEYPPPAASRPVCWRVGRTALFLRRAPHSACTPKASRFGSR